jgi:hypothetical protein
MTKIRSIHPKAHKYSALKLLEFEFNAAWAARDLQKCFHLLGQVLDINPRNADAMLLLGRMHGVQFEYDQAIEWFEKAIEISPRKQQAMVMLQAGKMARDFFDPAIAETFFQNAVDESDSVMAKLSLAEHLMRLRKLEMAIALVDEVLKTSPMDPAASLLWCRLHEGRLDECTTRLRRLMAVQSEELRPKAAYQLAKMLDAVGDYEGAMHALHTAKAASMTVRDRIVAHRQKIRASIKDLAKEYTPTKHAEWREYASNYGSSRKLALLGGHPRSGTTLLEQVLDSHPEVISAEETENFSIFSYYPLVREQPPLTAIMTVLESASQANLIRSRNDYFAAMDRCLKEPVGSRLLIDKNPSLTPLAPALFRLFPEIKFVTMIRDPRDVVLSCFMQSFFPVDAISGNFLTLEDAAAEYAAFMDTWLEVSKPLEEKVCEVRYEDMVEDLEGNARRVIGFLGLDWSASVMDYDRHAREKVVRSPTAEAVTEKVHTRAKARWKNYEKHLEPVFETLAPCMKALGYE